MDDSFCFRALYTVRVHMGHNIMTYLTFSLLCHIIVDIIFVRFQFIDLFLSDRSGPSSFSVSARCDPQSSPCAKLHIRRKNVLHFLTGITLRKGTYVSVCTHVIYSYHLTRLTAGEVSLRLIRFPIITQKLYNIASLKAIPLFLSLMKFAKEFFDSCIV